MKPNLQSLFMDSTNKWLSHLYVVTYDTGWSESWPELVDICHLMISTMLENSFNSSWFWFPTPLQYRVDTTKQAKISNHLKSWEIYCTDYIYWFTWKIFLKYIQTQINWLQFKKQKQLPFWGWNLASVERIIMTTVNSKNYGKVCRPKF